MAEIMRLFNVEIFLLGLKYRRIDEVMEGIMKETVLQFGTGNFLRAFFEPMLDIMRAKGLYSGRAVIVSPTDSGTVEKLNSQDCRYHVMLRGIENGAEYVNVSEVNSVSRAINPYKDFNAFLSLAKQRDLQIIVSNTTEAGIAFDEACRFDDRPQTSFPGKLTRFLYERFVNRLPGFIMLPCELIDDNGNKLHACVKKYIQLWGLSDAFAQWVETENQFCNTLVDRIVTGFPVRDADACYAKIGCTDPLLDTAEPYHLWVIEGDFENEFPLRQAGINVIWTSSVAPYKKMKVRILNGLHTSMVFPGMLSGLVTVADCMNDPLLAVYNKRILEKRILPTLEDSEEIKAFALAVKERFLNPYLHHRLASISLNSVSKFTVRILPTLKDNFSATGEIPKEFVLALAALIHYYKKEEAQDDAAAIAYIRSNRVCDILSNAALWSEDLSFLRPLVEECTGILNTKGIGEALEWSFT